MLAQAQRLGREDTMLTLIGPGHDMVANDMLSHMSRLEDEKHTTDNQRRLQRAEKILRNAAKQCKQELHTQQSADISFFSS